jgi:hypothetical protein
MESEVIALPPRITLEWSEWVAWSDLLQDARTSLEAVRVPNEPGVYEARLRECKERLTIGKAANLRMRVRQALVRGKVPHSAGKLIRTHERVADIVIRWAITDRPAAVEEELHRRYRERIGQWPKYTKHT